MYQSNQHTDRSQLVTNSINHSTWRRGLHLSALLLVVSWLALSPLALAVCREGCTPGNGGTFLGDDAGARRYETAIGSGALHLRVYRVGNTANGARALYNDTSVVTGTLPAAIARSLATKPASTTRPTAQMRSLATQPVTGTLPTAITRSLATKPANSTRPLVFKRSITTPAQTTSHWASMPAVVSPRQWQCLYRLQASWGLLARTTPPGSETFTPRSPLPG